MMSTSTGDAKWDGLRGILIMVGTLVAGYFGFAQETVAPLVDNIMMFASSAVALIAFVSLVYNKYRTVAVPIEVVIASERNPTVPTIPTVNPITGAIRTGPVGNGT